MSAMVRLSPHAFDRILGRVLDELPAEFARVVERVPIIVDPYPSDEVAATVEAPDELMGLFVGPTVAEWNASDAPPETAVIYLFQRQIEDACASRGEVADQIRITLLHELGHAVGFDEDGLDRLGLT